MGGEIFWCNTPFPQIHIHTHTFLKFVSILTKCVGKISWPNVIGKFGVFYHKNQNEEFYQYGVLQKSNFYRQWWLLKLYKIRTDDCGMAIMNIYPWNTFDFLPTTSYDVWNVMFMNQLKRWYENEAVMPT